MKLRYSGYNRALKGPTISAFSLALLLTILELSQALAGIPEIYSLKNGPSCNATLQNQIIKETSGGSIVIGDANSLESILTHSAHSETFISNTNEIYKGALNGRFNDPILVSAVKALNDSAETKDLIICAMNPSCTFKKNTVGALHLHEREIQKFTIQQITELRKLTPTELARELRLLHEDAPPKPEDTSHAIFLAHHDRKKMRDPLDKFDFNESDFFHEAVHYRDAKFFHVWVDANIKLIKKGEAPDALFSKYSLRSGDYFIISEGFWTFFTEARAYYVSQYLNNILLGFDETNPSRQIVKKVYLIKAVVDSQSSIGGDGSKVVASFGFPEDAMRILIDGDDAVKKWENLLFGSQSLENQMQITINRSKK